jgi:predicted phage terminase large subunit-like protein
VDVTPSPPSPLWDSLPILTPAHLGRLEVGARWQLPRHLAMLNRLLLALAARTIPRLLVTLPPRHGKSTLLSQFFPAWYLGLHPERRVILTSYEADYAAGWGRKSRDVLERWGGQFGVEVRRDSKAADRWELARHGGGMVTAGVGGPITGRGADVLIIDDPVKNAEQALSPTYRRRAVDWYASTAYTRLEPGGCVVLVMTRWHTEDLAGHVTEASPDGLPWHVVNLPAVAEAGDALGRQPGEALWPERYPLAALADIRAAIGTYWFQSLYQQTPINREGGLFNPAWFKVVDAAPAKLEKVVRYWDLAATEAADASDPDWTVGVLMGRSEGVYYVLDMQRMRGSPKKVEELLAWTAELDGTNVPVWIEQEGGASGKSLVSHYARLLAGYAVRPDKPEGDKVARANPLAAQAEAGNVRLVRGSWNRAWTDEMGGFPFASHDDIVDATGGAFRQLTAKRKFGIY